MHACGEPLIDAAVRAVIGFEAERAVEVAIGTRVLDAGQRDPCGRPRRDANRRQQIVRVGQCEVSGVDSAQPAELSGLAQHLHEGVRSPAALHVGRHRDEQRMRRLRIGAVIVERHARQLGLVR